MSKLVELKREQREQLNQESLIELISGVAGSIGCATGVDPGLAGSNGERQPE